MGLGIKSFIYLLLLKDNLREIAELVAVVLQKSQWNNRVLNNKERAK